MNLIARINALSDVDPTFLDLARDLGANPIPLPEERRVTVTATALKSGLELGDEGHPVGRDPRQMKPTELKKVGQFPKPLRAVIRERCVDCCGGQLGEVRKCVAVGCALWPYRMGTDPWGPSAAQQRQRAAALEVAAAQKNRPEPGGFFPETGPEASEYPADLSLKKSAPKTVTGERTP
jgi:hypothetical protein